MEGITFKGVVDISLAGIAIIEQVLSFTPKGYPKSISQCILWVGYKIYRLIKPKSDLKTVEVIELPTLSDKSERNVDDDFVKVD